MPEYVGPSLSNYLLVLGFLALLFVGLYYIKKNKHIISRTINSKKRMGKFYKRNFRKSFSKY